MNHEIFQLENSAMEMWRRGNTMGWAEISREDVIYIDPGLTKPIIGLEAYRYFLEKLAGQIQYEGSEFIDPEVVDVGDAAVLTYNYRSTIDPNRHDPDNQTVWNTTEVYFREAGVWKIAHTHWSYVNHRQAKRVDVPVPVQSTPPEYDQTLSELLELESKAMERWRKGDPWGFIEISAQYVTYFDTGTLRRINGREALRVEYATREGKIYYDVMEFIDPQVRVMGDIAVLVYRFFSTVLHEDGSIASRLPWNCTEVFQKIEGQWKIIHTHWSLIGGERT